MFLRTKKGFTLMELMVVIAIIGFLSSVVLTSLQSNRIKGRDAALKRSVLELRNFIELNRSNYSPNTYANIQSSGAYWSNGEGPPVASKYSCSTLGQAAMGGLIYTNLSATETTELRGICEKIVVLSQGSKLPNNTPAAYVLRIGTPTSTENYSIMVELASGGLYCLGSSGQSSITPGVGFFTTVPNVNANPGCRDNP